MKTDTHTPNNCFITTESPSSRSKGNINFNETKDFNDENYDEDVALVLQCNQTSFDYESSNVIAEGPSMISKMRGLINPAVKFEVDYEETVEDISNVLFMWRMNSATGKERSFWTLYRPGFMLRCS